MGPATTTSKPVTADNVSASTMRMDWRRSIPEDGTAPGPSVANMRNAHAWHSISQYHGSYLQGSSPKWVGGGQQICPEWQISTVYDEAKPMRVQPNNLATSSETQLTQSSKPSAIANCHIANPLRL